jgi:hypothetical protein
MSNVREYLGHAALTEVVPLCSALVDFCAGLGCEAPAPQAIFVLTAIVKLMSFLVISRQEFEVFFHRMPVVLMSALPNLRNTGADQKLLRAILSLFARLAFFGVITEVEIETIVSSIKKFDATEPFLVNMVQILAGAPIATAATNFVIRQPQAMRLMISAYVATPTFGSVVNHILSLGRHSRKNVTMCFEVGLELFLLDHLEKARVAQDIDEQNVRLLLDLLGMLFSHQADVKTVFRFLGLFRSFDDVLVSRYHAIFLDAIIAMVEAPLQPPTKFLALDGRRTSASLGRVPEIEHGFTFTFWIFVEESPRTYCPVIFTMQFGTHRIAGSLNNGNLAMLYQDARCEFQGILLKDLPKEKWVFVSVALEYLGHRAYLRGNINCRDGTMMALLVDDLAFLIDPLTLTVGGTVGECDSAPTRIVQCGLFPLLKEASANRLLELGILRSDQEVTFPVMPFHFFWDYGEATYQQRPLLLDTIAAECGVSVILPLFRSSALVLPDGARFDGQLSMSLKLLSLILQNSPRAQASMFDERGPEILKHLLLTEWTSTYSFKNYLQFVELAGSISHSGLRRALFNEIIADFSILCALPTATHMRILKHWHATLPADLTTFANLLSALRLYYFLTPCGSLCCLVRNADLDVEKCRDSLKEILVRVGSVRGVSARDFRLILCHCVDATDPGHATDILRLLVALVQRVPHATISFDCESVEFSRYILRIIQRNVPEVPDLVFQLFLALLDAQMVSVQHLSHLLHLLASHFPAPSPDVFSSLVEAVSTYPVFQLLCCALALKLSPIEVSILVASLDPCRGYLVDLPWIYWHLALCRVAADRERRGVLAFLARVAPDHWGRIFFLAGQSFPAHSDLLRRGFLEVLADVIPENLRSVTTGGLQLFFELSSFFIFSGSDPTQDLLRLVFGADFRSQRRLSLHLSATGDWSDGELAAKVVRLYRILLPQNYAPFVLALIAFLHRIRHPDAASLLAAVSTGCLPEHSCFLAFAAYHAHLSGGPSLQEADAEANDKVYSILSANIPRAAPEIAVARREWGTVLARCEAESCELMRSPVDAAGAEATAGLRPLAEAVQSSQKEGAVAWERLWTALSSGRGPWASENHIPLVRDCCECFARFPAKLTRRTACQFRTYTVVQGEIICECPCEFVTFGAGASALLKLRDDTLAIRVYGQGFVCLSLDEVEEVVMTARGMAVSTVSGPSFLLRMSEEIVPKICLHLPVLSSTPGVEFSPETRDWQNWRMSSFEYLMHLNRISGRTVHDYTEYPVFPWLGEGRQLNMTVDRRARYEETPMSADAVEKVAAPMEFSAFRREFPGNEAVPEVYAMPQYSSLENVYSARKLLESPEVSRELHNWISLIWSSDLSVHIRPLFQGLHPRRRDPPAPPKFNATPLFQLREKLEFAVVACEPQVTFCVIYFSLGAKTGGRLTFRLKNLDRPANHTEPLPCESLALAELQQPVYGGYDGKAVIFEARASVLHVLDLRTFRLSPFGHRARITSVASSGPWFVVGGCDSSLVLYSDLRLIWSSFLYREAVVACAVSDTFKAAVAGMGDGAIVICSLVNGSIVHVVPIAPEIPQAILITPAWGFVLFYATDVVPGSLRHWIWALTIDGAPIGRIEVHDKLSAWCCWRSRCGFDYVAFVCESGDIFIAEVINLAGVQQVHRAPNRIMRLAFVEDAQAIIAVSDAGSVFMLPFVPHE